MPLERWPTAQVETLAPDASSLKNARGVAAQFSSAGVLDEILWGLVKTYQVAVDLSGPAFKCSCPSRKIPCKHVLALLLLQSGGGVAPGRRLPFAAEWLQRRSSAAS